MAKVLLIYGGWLGHQPAETSAFFKQLLERDGHQVKRTDSLAVLDDEAYLRTFDLIVMHWTRGELSAVRFTNMANAVAAGTGLAGVHGGLLSAFQDNKKWLFMTGGCFVAHPGGQSTQYTVHITDPAHPATAGLADFSLTSEQYYVLTDPAIHVLATTEFAAVDHPNAANPLPVAWTKQWGQGRIFYHSLGHDLATCERPEIARFTRQGFEWAMRRPDKRD